MPALQPAVVALALCLGAAAASGRGLHADTYGTPEAATYYPPPAAAPSYAPAPAYQPTVYQLAWGFPSDLSPPLDAYPEQEAYVGDSANFSWTGKHGLWRVPTGDCPEAYDAAAPGYKEISAPKADGWAIAGPWTEPGTYWYNCPVPGHCAAGQKVKYVVSEYGGQAAGWWYAIDWARQEGAYRYPESLAKVGDALKFSWNGTYGVWRIPSGDCPETWDDKAAGVEVVAAPTADGSASYKFEKEGVYWFTSPTPGDCKDGWVRYKWTVAA